MHGRALKRDQRYLSQNIDRALKHSARSSNPHKMTVVVTSYPSEGGRSRIKQRS